MVTCQPGVTRCKSVPVQIVQPNLRNCSFFSLRWSRPASLLSHSRKRGCDLSRTPACAHLVFRPARTLSTGTAAWAGARFAAQIPNVSCSQEVNTEFCLLCSTQLQLISETLRQPEAEVAGPLSLCLTLYKREADSLDEGQLQLCQISSLAVPGLDSLGKQQTLDRWLSLGSVNDAASAHGAEEALAQAQLVDLPHNGGLVLPLAAHGFLVGLLVIEGFSAQASLSMHGLHALTGHKKEMVTLAGRVLASACAMELHSALERAQSQLRTQQVVGLVEEVRGPLTALRTLGSILAPRLQQAKGREVDRDVVKGMLTQGDRLQDLVKQLQAAIHPAEGPSVLKQLAQQELTQPMTHPLKGSETNLKQLKGAVDQTQLLLPLIPGTQQESSDSD